MRNSRGGGIGLEPVYAAADDVTYDSAGSTLKYEVASTSGGSTTPTEIKKLVVNGVTIGSANGEITASKIVGTGTDPSVEINGVKIGAVSDGSVTMHTIGSAITISGTSTAMYDVNIGNNLTVKGQIIDSNDVSKAVSVADLADAVGQVETNRINIINNKNDIAGLKTKTTGISYSTATGTIVDGVQLKEKGISAAGGAFTVNGTDGETVVSGIGGKTTINHSSIVIEDTTSSKHVIITNEDVNASHSVQAKIIDSNTTARMADGNVVAKNGLYVGAADITAPTKDNSKFSVDGTTGDTAVGGNLSVAGTTTFTGETTFGNGIKTDKISENTPNAGVTVDGNLHANKNAFVSGKLTVDGDIEGKGALKGKTLGIGTNGSEFIVDENGAVKAAGGKVEIDKNGNAQFGDTGDDITKIEGSKITTGRIETSDTQASRIGGVILQNGQITADSMTINGAINLDDLTVKNQLTVGDFVVDKTGAVTGLQSINGVAVAKSGTGLTIGSATIGDANPFRSTGFKVDNVGNVEAVKVTAGTITDGNGFTATGGNVTATGTVQGKTISDNAGATLTGGKITAQEGKIGNVVISAAGEVSGVTSLTVNNDINANTFKVNEGNYLDGNGITATGGHIGGAVIDATTLKIGNTILKANGITTDKLTIGDMVLTGTGLNTGTNDFQVNGVTFNQGKVTAKASEGFAAGNSSFKEGSLIVDDNNKLEATNGLTTQKATVTGTLDVTGKATFGTGSDQTTINGKTVTTDTLRANSLILGTSGDATVEVDKDGSLMAAKGKFKVDKDGALKAANGAFNVDKDGKTTFTKDADNLSSINGGNIWAKATDAANHTSSELQHDSTGLHVSGTHAGKTSAFAFDAATGISTFTGQDNSTVTINGSAIRSAKSDGTAGRLDGENLTLYKDANNQTTMSAGKATFKSDNAGKYNGKETTIDGGVITTDTLNVQRINLGKEMVNSDGTTTAVSNFSIDEHGNIKAAGGNFTVAGTDQGNNKGALHNEVGNTSFNTTVDGASMKFDNTAAAGGVTSEVAVEANKATVAAGEKASFVATTDNGGTATITGGTQTVTTTDKGTVFENSAHKTAFVDNGATNTIINGNEITTGKITTDQLVITGKGNADGNGGSIAFGGNGTIKSDINDGTANGKNTSFETTLDGVNTKVTDGTTTTENKVTAEGNSNTVKQDDTHKSEFNQGLTSIGGVVTNGEIKVAQKLDGATGLLTNEVTNADGKWSKLEQSGTGLTYTDSANAGNATRIDSSDVSIGSVTEPDKRINLSDLGQIDELDKELTGHDKYKDNPTAVGGINAEAAIRREEVARLDGRINDVNDRVNKVGAMAAAIASLKSIGYDPQAPSEFSIGLGQYKGETGVAMGFFHYPNKNFMINVSLSTAGGETMGGIGATWRFGHKSPQKLLEEQREEQAKKELAAAEKYQAAAKLAKEAQERAEYAAKLARQAQVSADNAKAAADATQAKHFG